MGEGAAVDRAGWQTCGRADAQAGAVSGLQMERQEVSMTNARESVGQPAGGTTRAQVGWSMGRLTCRRLLQVGADMGVGFREETRHTDC